MPFYPPAPHPFGPHGPYDPMRHHHPKHPPYMVDKCAEQCDDQLPLFSQVGRGLRGDSYRVLVSKDSLTETILEGLRYDEHTGALESEWFSENINGGHLSYMYNLRTFSNPQTFTITFKYVRPGRAANSRGVVWSWTTPAIPYIWDADNDGVADVDGIIGSGVADLFLKKTTEPKWNYPTVTYTDYKNGKMTGDKHDKIVYPDGWIREEFNAPIPGDPWTVNLQYGIGGDIDAPNIDDLAKVLGITVDNIRNIIKNSPMPTETIPDENLKKYIDRRDNDLDKHIHQDMGFDEGLINDGNTLGNNRNTIKKYIDTWVADLQNKLLGKTWNYGDSINNTLQFNGNKYDNMKAYVDARCNYLNNRITNELGDANKKINALQGQLNSLADAFDALVKRIYGASLDKSTQAATSTANAYTKYAMNFSVINEVQSSVAMIPMGNINLLSNTGARAVLTHDPASDKTGDVKAT